ncbi:MAG TPA: hypothetical protein VJL07_02605 [Dehalococcoidia bacterium]|nr:hypothetical protein [Dehalococcoidia bacterium]
MSEDVKLADLNIREIGEWVIAFLQPGGAASMIEVARIRADICRSDPALRSAWIEVMRQWFLASSRRIAGIRPIRVETTGVTGGHDG